MTTIKDVAKHAGVSITTVSYVLNHTGTISTATRKRVLSSAEALKYQPNAFARNLKNQTTLTIGVFISAFGGLFYDEILEGIHQAVLQSDYELIVCPDREPVRKVLIQRQVDGAIIFDTKIKTEVLMSLVSKKFPIVVMDRFIQADYLLPLLIDNKQGTREAFYHLYNQGARRIVMISGARDSFDNMERVQTFFEEARKNYLAIQQYEGNFTEESGYENGRIILQSHPLPEAIFCANDQMAIGLIRAMKEKGLKAPDDIGVIGFDDIQIARYMQPSLSTINASRFLWGSTAATQLIDFLHTGKPFQAYRIPTKLIPRESSFKNYSRLSN